MIRVTAQQGTMVSHAVVGNTLTDLQYVLTSLFLISLHILKVMCVCKWI